jgi:hypothetical protein
LEKEEIQKQYILLQNQHAAAENQSRQVDETAQAHIAELQSKQEFLQSEYTAVVNRNQQITAEERKRFQAQAEHMQTYLRYRDEVATIAIHQTSLLRDSLSQFRQDTAEQLHAL